MDKLRKQNKRQDMRGERKRKKERERNGKRKEQHANKQDMPKNRGGEVFSYGKFSCRDE